MKLIVIFGAGPGISQGVARRFGKEGFRIALAARSESNLKGLVNDLKKENIDATYAVCDVSDEISLKKALSEIRQSAGHAEMILYNAAAISVRDILDQDWETIKSTVDVSAGGYFNLMKAVLPYCLANNTGKLFATGGGFALQGDPLWTSLSVGKAALRNLVQAFQKRAEGTNVHVAQLTVCGYVNSQDKKYNPESIAEQYWKLFNQKSGEFEHEIIY